MKLTVAVCVALLAVVLVQAEEEMAPPSLPDDTRLANGRPAAPLQFPFMAYIERFKGDGSSCAGSLITRSAVLTTVAWCVSNATKWRVRLGSIYRQGEDANAWTVESVMAIMHPQYYSNNYDNNIAIIQLPRRAPVNEFIQPVSLPSSPVVSSYLGSEGIVAGWGWTDAGSGTSDVLSWAEVLVFHNDFCKQLAGSYAVTDRQLCAGSSGATAHHNDHGAPLVLYTRGRYTQIGVYSWPTSWEFNTSHPAIYTRVTPYLDWIKVYTEYD